MTLRKKEMIMEAIDSLKPAEEVTVTVFGPEGSTLYQNTATGFHSLEAAVRQAIAGASPEINPEDCVFEVSNRTTGVSHRYRINAHGHLKLIV